jgi:hypothetical protein
MADAGSVATQASVKGWEKIKQTFTSSNEKLGKIELFMGKIVLAFTERFTKEEFFLNALFIILIIIFGLIIYWDSINRKVATTSRCKRQIDIYNKNKGHYVIEATDKSKNPLYKVVYDTNQKNTDVQCNCKEGSLVNYFNGIPVKDTKANKDVKIDKVCSCDKYYNVGLTNDNVVYDGEPGIIRYMTSGNSDFFDNLIFSEYASYNPA